MKADNSAAVAEFLARGGKVRKVAPEASLGLTDRQWAKTVRGELTSATVGVLRGTADLQERIAENRAEVAHDYAHVGDREGAIFAATGGVDWHVIEEYKRQPNPRFAFVQDGEDFYFYKGGHVATWHNKCKGSLELAQQARAWFIARMASKGVDCEWPNPFE